MAAPCDGKVNPGGEHEMHVPGKQFHQAPEIGDEGGVRQVVEIVQNDDDLRQVDHLRSEFLEECITESFTVDRDQRAKAGKVSVDRGQSGQQPIGEADGVVVGGADIEPNELQLGVGKSPLGQKDRLA